MKGPSGMVWQLVLAHATCFIVYPSHWEGDKRSMRRCGRTLLNSSCQHNLLEVSQSFSRYQINSHMQEGSIKMLYRFPTLLLRLWANVSIRQHVTWLGKQVLCFCSNADKTKTKQTTAHLHSQFLPSAESQVCLSTCRQNCKKERIFIIHEFSFPQKLAAQFSASPKSSQPWRGGCPISLWGLCTVLWDWQTKFINPTVTVNPRQLS